jgi:excisionase family DNA binding protein
MFVDTRWWRVETNPRQLLKAAEVAVQLKVCLKWVYAHQGALGAVRMGRTVRFRQEHIDLYLQNVEVK